jgi:hypothetical protein
MLLPENRPKYKRDNYDREHLEKVLTTPTISGIIILVVVVLAFTIIVFKTLH